MAHSIRRDYDALFKLVLIGDSGVGKSCLLLRFAVSKSAGVHGGGAIMMRRRLFATFGHFWVRADHAFQVLWSRRLVGWGLPPCGDLFAYIRSQQYHAIRPGLSPHLRAG